MILTFLLHDNSNCEEKWKYIIFFIYVCILKWKFDKKIDRNMNVI